MKQQPADTVSIRATGDFTKEICLPRTEAGLTGRTVSDLFDATMSSVGDNTKLLVLCTEGHDFCLGQVSSTNPVTFLQFQQILAALATAPFLSVALIRGKAFDAGADLAIACDWRVVTMDAELRFAHSRSLEAARGARLAQIVGASRAFDAIVRRQSIDAAEALRLGLATESLDEAGRTPFVAEIQAQLADISKSSISLLRGAVSSGADGSGDVERVASSLAISHSRAK